MKLTSLVFLLSLLTLTVSCGKGGKSEGKKYTKLTQEQISTILDNQILSCGSIGGKPCPDGIVRLLILNKKQAEKSSVCSGFMVGPNRLVTNYHCVSNKSDCKNTYVAIYDGHDYVQSKCSKLIKSQQDYKKATDSRRAIDYAVLEIEDQYNGNTFKLAQTRAQVGDKVTAWVVDHTGLDKDGDLANPFEARVTELACEVDNQPSEASMILKKCPVLHGNSGSAVVNAAGEIVGVIWGATGADTNSNTSLSIRRMMQEYGLVTEMHHFAPYVNN